MLMYLRGGEIMNIAMVNMGSPLAMQPKNQTQSDNSQAFGNVFGQILSSQNVSQTSTTNNMDGEQNLVQDLLAILNVKTMEEAQEILQMDELIVSPKELNEVLHKLLRESNETEDISNQKDIWDILSNGVEQPNKLVDNILLALKGQALENTSPVDAKQAIELLKIVQLIGNKSDLTFKQDSTLFDLNQALETLKENITNISIPQEVNVKPIAKAFIQQVMMNQSVVKGNNLEVVTEIKEVAPLGQGQTTSVQTKVETVTMTLPTEKPAQSEEFLKELQKVMNRVQFGQAAGANRLVIKLYPEQLGTIRIELIQKDGILTAKMLASTALGKELLDTHSGQLRQGLANQNVQIEKLEITQALQDPAKQERNQGFQDSAFKHQGQDEQHQEESEVTDKETTFQEFLSEIEV